MRVDYIYIIYAVSVNICPSFPAASNQLSNFQGWGKTIVVGVDKPGARISFSSNEVLHLGKTVQGSLFGGLKPKSDIPILIKRYIDKVVIVLCTRSCLDILQRDKVITSRVFPAYIGIGTGQVCDSRG